MTVPYDSSPLTDCHRFDFPRCIIPLFPEILSGGKEKEFICPRRPQNMSEQVSVWHLLAYALGDICAQSTLLPNGLLSVSGVCEELDY